MGEAGHHGMAEGEGFLGPACGGVGYGFCHCFDFLVYGLFGTNEEKMTCRIFSLLVAFGVYFVDGDRM